MRFLLDGKVLYKKGKDQILLRCVNSFEENKIIEEIHEEIYGTHANGHKMAKQVMRAGYYWLTLESDCIKYARKCHKCQIYSDKIMYLPQSYMLWHHLGLSQCGAWMSLDPYL